MCCQIVHNVFYSSVSTLARSPLAQPLGEHLMKFLSIYNTGPNRFPNNGKVGTAAELTTALTAPPQALVGRPNRTNLPKALSLPDTM